MTPSRTDLLDHDLGATGVLEIFSFCHDLQCRYCISSCSPGASAAQHTCDHPSPTMIVPTGTLTVLWTW